MCVCIYLHHAGHIVSYSRLFAVYVVANSRITMDDDDDDDQVDGWRGDSYGTGRECAEYRCSTGVRQQAEPLSQWKRRREKERERERERERELKGLLDSLEVYGTENRAAAATIFRASDPILPPYRGTAAGDSFARPTDHFTCCRCGTRTNHDSSTWTESSSSSSSSAAAKGKKGSVWKPFSAELERSSW